MYKRRSANAHIAFNTADAGEAAQINALVRRSGCLSGENTRR